MPHDMPETQPYDGAGHVAQSHPLHRPFLAPRCSQVSSCASWLWSSHTPSPTGRLLGRHRVATGSHANRIAVA
jgi:hypothetical protein